MLWSKKCPLASLRVRFATQNCPGHGAICNLPPTAEMREKFGGYLNQSITDVSMVKKPQANCSILIDVLNHIVLDAMVEPCLTSELPMLYKHLENCKEILHGKKVILLCDRYYGSAELFLYCMLHGYSFVTRAKTYMYKEQVKLIEQDGDNHVFYMVRPAAHVSNG